MASWIYKRLQRVIGVVMSSLYNLLVHIFSVARSVKKSVTKTGWVSRCILALCAIAALPAFAQGVPGQRRFGEHSAGDRGELREAMRKERRERRERDPSFGPAVPADLSAVPRRNDELSDREIAARRERWQRLSPDERQQLRRDIHQAGREFYPRNPRRDGE